MSEVAVEFASTLGSMSDLVVIYSTYWGFVNGGAKSGHGAEQNSSRLGVTGALANVLPI